MLPIPKLHPVKILLQLYRGEASKLFWALFFYCIKHAGVWLWPLLTANVIDVISNPETRPLSDLWLYGFILFVVYVQNVPFNYVYMHFFSTANRNMERHLRARLTRRLQRLSMSYYHKKTTGALQTKMLRDVEVIEQLTRQLFESVPITLITIGIAVIVTAIRVPWFLIFYVFFIPMTMIVTRTMKRPLQQSNRNFREEVEGMSSRVIEMLNLLPVTRAHGIEQREITRVDEKLLRVRQAGRKLDRMNALFGSIAWVAFQLATALCLITAAYFAYTQTLPITVGDVVLLTGYFANITAGISALVGLVPQITKGFESVYSLAEILEEPDLEQNEGKRAIESVTGHFELDHVSFAYPDSEENSLSNITLDVKPGETIAFVGASGAGKSTLINLLIGFVRPSQGQILIDGQNMSELDLRSYRHFLSVVPQKTILLDGTIRDNIAYGVKHASDEVIWKALKDANAAGFVSELAYGIDTWIGEDGARLSGGQRQRLAIARALIRNPRVLILDEATSALDPQSEKLIQQALENLMQDRTAFIVAHRLSTIRHADRIVVMDNGQIVEIGNHNELMQRNQVYAKLHQTAHAS